MALVDFDEIRKRDRFDWIVVDGGHLSYRCLFAFRDLTVELPDREVYTGVPYGIFRYLLFIKRIFGGKIIIAWDGGKDSRREIDPNYKTHRDDKRVDEIFETFFDQLNLACYLLDLAGIKQFRTKGYEGDELISTICHRYKRKKRIAVLSGDHDMFQTITDNVSLLRPTTKGLEIIDKKEFMEQHLYEPENYWAIQALAGCSGDGVKGIEKVGEKTALKILVANGWYRGLLERLKSGEKIEGCSPKIVERLDFETIVKTRKLTFLRYNVPVKKYNKRERDIGKLMKEFSKYRMFSLLKDGTKILKGLGQ